VIAALPWGLPVGNGRHDRPRIVGIVYAIASEWVKTEAYTDGPIRRRWRQRNRPYRLAGWRTRGDVEM